MNSEMLSKEIKNELQDILDIKINNEQSRKIVDLIFDKITDTLTEGRKVKIVNFGEFSISERAERQGRNPSTGQSLIIPAHYAVKFKVSSKVKEKLNNIT